MAFSFSSPSGGGGGGGDTWTEGETPTGVINGINTVFTTLVAYESGKLRVFYNGQRRYDITELVPAAGTYQLGTAPLTGSELRNDYVAA